MEGMYVTKFDGEPVLQYEFRADIWTGTRAEVVVDNAFYRFGPGQQIEITNEVDRFPDWLRRLGRWINPGWRPRRVTYRITMVVEYVTSRNRVGLIDLTTWLAKHAVVEEDEPWPSG